MEENTFAVAALKIGQDCAFWPTMGRIPIYIRKIAGITIRGTNRNERSSDLPLPLRSWILLHTLWAESVGLICLDGLQ